MKKLFVFVLATALVSNIASASLIGVGSLIDNQYPDIHFNNIGAINYTAWDGLFVLTANDLQIAYSETSAEYLNGLVDMVINLDINTGSGTMTEVVKEGAEVTIRGVTYTSGTTILAGDVYAFGFGDTANGQGFWDFDFLVENISGALVDNEVWPGNVDTGIVATAENWDGWANPGNWDEDFTLYKVKGDKAPIPEPATMAILGLGALLLRKRT